MSIEESTNGNMSKPEATAEAVQHTDERVHPPAVRKTGGVYRFFRSVFTHIVFAMFVVTGVLGYLLHSRMIAVVGDTVLSDKYLGNYMQKQASSSPASVASSGTTKKSAAVTSGTNTVDASKVSPGVSSQAPSEASTVTESKVTPSASQSKATPSASVSKVTPQITSSPPKKPSTVTVAAKTKPATSTPTKKTQSVATIKNDQPAATLKQSWQQARQYYASGKAEAEAAYLNLIQNYPDNPDLPGELGNIYYNAGKFAQAATQYYNAALIQLSGSRPEMAACILHVLERLDRRKAYALRGKLTRACPTRR